MDPIVVEKANRRLGVIVFKCLSYDPGVEDLDGDIPDPESVEAAFYDWMAERPKFPVDLDHKERIEGDIVAAWNFPDEHCFRVAFRPKDPSVVELAESGDIMGSSYAAMVHREAIDPSEY